MGKGPEVVRARNGEGSTEEESDIRYGRKVGSINGWRLAPIQSQQEFAIWGAVKETTQGKQVKCDTAQLPVRRPSGEVALR